MNRLENMQKGDSVALRNSAGRGSLVMESVGRTTPTRVYIGELAYLRSTGRPVGAGSWSMVRVEVWDADRHLAELEAIRAERRLRASRQRLSAFGWSSLSQEQANDVLRVVAAFSADRVKSVDAL